MESLSLKNLKFHEDMSEETPCFSADLYDNGVLVAHVKNSGHGGCNDVHPAKGKTWKDVQKYTDLDTDCHIMGLAEELNIVKKKQTNCLVLKKGDNIYTLKFKYSFSKIRKSMNPDKWNDFVAAQVRNQEAQGYKVLNTNLGL